MARIVDTYECEWRKAIEEPATLRRFRHFVNSDRTDADVVFVEERGQVRPATAAERRARRPAPRPALEDVAMNAWRAVCEAADILPDTGVCADIEGKQVAVFRVDEAVYALDNRDPASDANVLSRGIVGDLGGEIVVASPIYKHHFSLATGRCLEEPDYSINTYPARVVDGKIWIRPQARRRDRAAGKRRLVVIGNGMAGMRTVEELLKVAPALYDIEIFGAEPHGNYNRVLLSPLLAGEKHADEIMLHPLEWYREQGVTLAHRRSGGGHRSRPPARDLAERHGSLL